MTKNRSLAMLIVPYRTTNSKIQKSGSDTQFAITKQNFFALTTFVYLVSWKKIKRKTGQPKKKTPNPFC
jgi:hypothetical protein